MLTPLSSLQSVSPTPPVRRLFSLWSPRTLYPPSTLLILQRLTPAFPATSPSNTFPTKCLPARAPTRAALLRSTTALAPSSPRLVLWVLARPASPCFRICHLCPSPTHLESPLTYPTSASPHCSLRSPQACPLTVQPCQCLPCCLSPTPRLLTLGSSLIVLPTTSATFLATMAVQLCKKRSCCFLTNWCSKEESLILNSRCVSVNYSGSHGERPDERFLS